MNWLIYDSNYWIEAVALEKINNHEIVVLERNKDIFTIRHAKNENDWLYNQAAYVNEPILVDKYGKAIPIDIKIGDLCRCLIVDVVIK